MIDFSEILTEVNHITSLHITHCILMKLLLNSQFLLRHFISLEGAITYFPVVPNKLSNLSVDFYEQLVVSITKKYFYHN